MDIKKPGYETADELWSSNPKYLKRFVDKNIIPFLNIKNGDRCLDLGEKNPRMEYIKEVLKELQFEIEVSQIDYPDFNFANFQVIDKADVVFALEVIEHLQNPLLFMRELKKLTDGSIYVLFPCNPRWLWHEKHFNEMSRKHFEKWILKPLDLKIVRYKKIIFVFSWRKYLIGFRPLLRLLTGKTTIHNQLRSFFYVQWGIYEIRKN
jgi:hypothetical protein